MRRRGWIGSLIRIREEGEKREKRGREEGERKGRVIDRSEREKNFGL
jgi:hypothetical protein